MKTVVINKVKNALDAVQDAAYLAFRYDEQNQWNEMYRKRVGEALVEIEQLEDRVFEDSWIFDKLREEVKENLLQYPNDRPYVMKEIIWKLFAPFQRGLFADKKTLDVVISSYNEKILDCSILGAWEDDEWKDGMEDDYIKDYLYRANFMALHIIEALNGVVEKDAFVADCLKVNNDSLLTKETRRRGRPSKCLKDNMIDDADGAKLRKIHELIDGKHGKAAYLIIVACIDNGWMNTPTHKQIINEFGNIGAQSGFSRYLKKNMYSPEEFDGVKKSLKE